MGYAKYLRELWRSEEYQEELQKRLIDWRKETVVKRLDKPTRLDRAHSLGYKAKQGFVIARIRIGKGTTKRETPSGGRKPTKTYKKKATPKMNLQHIAEIRVAKHYPNLEVLNSYYVAEDGKSKWFEVILVDPEHPVIKNDNHLNWICDPANRGRVYRGLTSAGKSSRGLGRGKGFEHK